MSLDSATDPQLAAMLTLAQGAVNANLRAALGVDAIVKVTGHPIPIEIVSTLKLPILSIHRQVLGQRRRGSMPWRNGYERAELVIEYITTPTPLDKLDTRWPLLRLVWRELLLVLQTGHHVDVGGNAPIMELAGVVALDLARATARCGFVEGESTVFPRFVGNLAMEHEHAADLTKLDALVSLDARYLLGTNEIVRDIVTVPLAVGE